LVLILLGQLWNPWFPINKKLWTSSFVLFMGGCSMVLWALLIWLIEIKGWRKGLGLLAGLRHERHRQLRDVGPAGRASVGHSRQAPHVSLGYWIYLHVFALVHPPGIASLLYSDRLRRWPAGCRCSFCIAGRYSSRSSLAV
jgi:hypothetical protein